MPKRFALAISLFLTVAVVACGEDEPKPPADTDVDDAQEVETIESCPATGALLRAAPVLLSFEAAAGSSASLELTLNNGGSGQLCFDPEFYTLEPDDGSFAVAEIERDGGPTSAIDPGQNAKLVITFSPQFPGTGTTKLSLHSRNGGDAEVRLGWTAGMCTGTDCPMRPLERVCGSTPGQQEGLFVAEFEVASVQRLALLAAEPGTAQIFAFLTLPSSYNDVLDQTRWAKARVYTEEFDILMPSLVPTLSYVVTDGHYQVEGQSAGSEFCFYVLDQEGPGRRLGLNVHLCGLSGLSSSLAPLNSDWLATLDALEALLAANDITLDRNNIAYADVPATEAAQFRVLTSGEDFHALLATSEFPAPTTRDSLLRLNVFLIDSFALGEDGVVGLSPLYGMPGGHGTELAGIAIAAGQYLGETIESLDDTNPGCFEEPTPSGCIIRSDGNEALAEILAHEAGHFFGLGHTTELGFDEQGNTIHDDLADTPECDHPDDLSTRCADEGNLMFPLVRPKETPSFSPQQKTRILANPLLQP